MHSLSIQKIVGTVLKKYKGFEYYGSSSVEEHSVCFKLQDNKATFSVSTLDGALTDTYDIQVEGIPAGEYVYTDEVTLNKFLELMDIFTNPTAEWP